MDCSSPLYHPLIDLSVSSYCLLEPTCISEIPKSFFCSHISNYKRIVLSLSCTINHPDNFQSAVQFFFIIPFIYPIVISFRAHVKPSYERRAEHHLSTPFQILFMIYYIAPYHPQIRKTALICDIVLHNVS